MPNPKKTWDLEFHFRHFISDDYSWIDSDLIIGIGNWPLKIPPLPPEAGVFWRLFFRGLF